MFENWKKYFTNNVRERNVYVCFGVPRQDTSKSVPEVASTFQNTPK
jgi:hypothetical protein